MNVANGKGEGPIRTPGKEVDASSVTPVYGRPAETKKARYVVALSRSVATTGTCDLGRGEILARPTVFKIFLQWQGRVFLDRAR